MSPVHRLRDDRFRLGQDHGAANEGKRGATISLYNGEVSRAELARYRLRRPSPHYGFVRGPWLLLARALDAIGSRVPLPGFAASEPRRVALLHFGHIGDGVLLTPTLRALRAAVPEAHLCLVVGPWLAPLFAHDPSVDEVRPFRAAWMDPRGGLRSPGALLSATSASLMGRGLTELLRGFDLTLSFTSYLPEHVAALRAGVPRRAGWSLFGGGFLLTDTGPFPWEEHALIRNLRLLQVSGLLSELDQSSPALLRPHLALGPEDHAAAEAFLVEHGLLQGPKVALHVGAGYPSKRWPLERYISLARELRRQGLELILVGGSGDREACETVAEALGEPVSLAAGRLALREAAALLSRCQLFIGNDSGPAHLSAAVGTRTIVLFSGENEAAIWQPWGEHVALLQVPPPCSPCGLPLCPVPGHPCMSDLTVEMALRQALR